MRRAPKADSPPKRRAPRADYPTRAPKADCPTRAPCAHFGAFCNTFRFPKSELPSTHGHANAKNIPILEKFRRSDQNVHFGESEPNIRKIGNTHQDTKNVHISEKIYITQHRSFLRKSIHLTQTSQTKGENVMFWVQCMRKNNLVTIFGLVFHF